MHTDSDLAMLYKTCRSGHVPLSMKALARANAREWKWATASMSNDVPFDRELTGGPPVARWLNEEEADPLCHVRHGLDQQGRIIIEVSSKGEDVLLYAPQGRIILNWRKDGTFGHVIHHHYQDGRIVTSQHGHPISWEKTHYKYEGDRLQSAVISSGVCNGDYMKYRKIFSYDADGALDRVYVPNENEDGEVQAEGGYLEYMRLPEGETMESIEARVQALLEESLASAAREIPRDKRLRCVLLNYGRWFEREQWPPSVLWVGESSWSRVCHCADALDDCEACKFDIVSSCHNENDNGWVQLQKQSLVDACVKHAYLIDRAEDYTSASRVLFNLRKPVETMIRETEIPVTDDFFVAHVDFSEGVDRMTAMLNRKTAEGKR